MATTSQSRYLQASIYRGFSPAYALDLIEDVLAIGDGANDKLMIEEAGLGVAYRAKPALAEVADARLDHHGLDALLWAQGIRKRDWVGR